MKKVSKIVAILIIVFLSLIILLVGFAEFFEDKITDVALNKIRETIDAPLAIEDISFSLIKEFPLATLELSGVWLGQEIIQDSAANRSSAIDTLVRIDQANLSVYLLPLMKGKYELNEVAVSGALVNYQVDSAGISNFDFLIPSGTPEESDTSVAAFSLLLDKLMLENVRCQYQDNNLKAAANIFVPNINVEGSITNEAIDISSEGIIRLTDCQLDSTNLSLMNLTEVTYKLDYADETVTIHDLTVDTDGALLSANGQVTLQDTLLTNLKLVGSNFSLDELIKYAPVELLDEEGLKKLSGRINMTGTVNGVVSDSLLPRIDVKFALEDGLVKTVDYPTIQNMNVRGEMSNGALQNNQTTSLSIDAFHIETEESSINGNISLRNLDRINYRITTQADLNIDEFQQYVPDSLVEHIEGNVQVNLSTRGVVPDSISDAFIKSVLANSVVELSLDKVQLQLDSTLSIDSLSGRMNYQSNYISASGLQVEVPAYHFKLKNGSIGVGFNGNITQLETLELNVDSFLFQTPQSMVEGTTWIKNLSYPNYKLDSKMHLNLDDLGGMVPDTLVKKMSGDVNASIQSAGKIHLDSIVDHLIDLVMNESSILVDVKNVNVEMPDTLINVKNFSGQVALKSDTIDITNLSGECIGIEFGVDSAQIANVYRSVIVKDTLPLMVHGNLAFGHIDYAMFEPFMESDSTITTELEQSSGSPIVNDTSADVKGDPLRSLTNLGFNFQIKGKVRGGSIKYKDVLLNKMSCYFNFRDSLYLLDQLKCNAFKGNINNSFRYEIHEEKSILFFSNQTNGVDINQALRDFDDFKEYDNTYIDHNQLSGLLSTNILAEVVIRDSINTEEIRMQGDMLLENGHLKNYDVAVEIGEEYNIDNTDNIIFQTIDTKMFMFDNAFYVPLTNIKSNTFDVSIFGMQKMDMDCEYHLRFYLKELLNKGESKRSERKQADASRTKKDGGTKGLTSIFVPFIIKNSEWQKKLREGEDSDGRRDMKRKLRVKEKQIKLIFNPDLVVYDTGVR
ncbi:MAG: AsmA family protein [Marinilabiliaceae bacterium]|nr:AsmA family protein [Marinilabiliaceae bacterium]